VPTSHQGDLIWQLANHYGTKLAKQFLGKNAVPNIGDGSDGQFAEFNRFSLIQRPSSFGNLVQINLQHGHDLLDAEPSLSDRFLRAVM
jgi:hypothetical protein